MGALASALAGLVGWMVVQVAIIGLGHWIQAFYLVLGMLIVVLAARLRRIMWQMTKRTNRVRVLIYGAGIIGQVYGGRLAQAGHDVTLLARGRTFEALTERGVSLRTGNESFHGRPQVIRAVPPDVTYDVVLVTVRRDQVDGIMPAVAELPAGRVVFMLNQTVDLDGVAQRVGADRTVFAFPGVGGHPTEDGAIHYLEVPQQKTTVGRRGGLEEFVVDLLRSARFPVAVSNDMDGWLKTHAVFVTVLTAAILEGGGNTVALAADPLRVGEMVAAVGEGFRALARAGVSVTPTPLRLIFTVVPRFAAVHYWQGLLRGPVGATAMAPHARASRETEFPVLRADVRQLVAGHGPSPHLDRLLDAVPSRLLRHGRPTSVQEPPTGRGS